jgi:hypothetical protein
VELTLDISQLVLTAAVLVVALLRLGPSRRSRRRLEIAAMAVDYAEQMGGTNPEKLTHAIGAFQRIDLADNGKRDYSDAEARIAVEAILGAKK